MKRRIVASRGNTNVFADLGLRDAEKLKIKSGLVIQIVKAVCRLGLRAMSWYIATAKSWRTGSASVLPDKVADS